MRPATLVGEVVQVSGTKVGVRLRSDQPSIALVGGESLRVGQIGAILRIPVGYADVYGMCTEVGSVPTSEPIVGPATDDDHREPVDGRWLTLALFGEVVAGDFQRGVGSYPTIADEVHLATASEIERIHAASPEAVALDIGTVASTSSTPALLDMAKLVTRHSAVVGSTGSGKSNLVATVLQGLASAQLTTARVIVIDTHGEYADALGDTATVFCTDQRPGAEPLVVPFWALPFDELVEATLGSLTDHVASEIRTEVERRRREAAVSLTVAPPDEAITADSPIPFSAKSLWMDLRQVEDQTYIDPAKDQPTSAIDEGDVKTLRARAFPAHGPGTSLPYAPAPRYIDRALTLMRNRLTDVRYRFLFEPGERLTPDDIDGSTAGDLDELLASWIGHDRPVTVLDMSAVPADVLPLVTGTVLRLVYDALFWAGDLPVSGRAQPLLVVLEEAHRFVREGGGTIANRTVSMIAKEGRKYGVGLMLVTQRPSDLDKDALSQCGTIMALRMTNETDRGRVASAMPDVMRSLADQLPALRTGEVLISGEAAIVPTRARVRRAEGRLRGADADVRAGWTKAERPATDHYAAAIAAWRAMSPAASGE